MAELIILIGIPGSGKTSWAYEQLEEGYADTVHSSDVVREELGDIHDQSQNPLVFSIIHNRIIKDLREDKRVIFDATNLRSKYRREILTKTKHLFPLLRTTAKVFIADFETIKRQNESRVRVVPAEVIRKMVCQFQPPIYEEGFDVIDIVRHLDREWTCEEFWHEMDQDNHHHSLLLTKHNMATYSYLANQLQCQDNGLLVAAMSHDIGKYYTKSFTDRKGYPAFEATYYGHDSYGAYICLFDEMIDIEDAWLIAWHMRPFVWDNNPKVKEKDRSWMGDRLVAKLDMLHEADLAAQ